MLFFEFFFGYCIVPVLLHTKFKVRLSIFVKKAYKDFNWNCTDSIDCFRENLYLNIKSSDQWNSVYLCEY